MLTSALFAKGGLDYESWVCVCVVGGGGVAVYLH